MTLSRRQISGKGRPLLALLVAAYPFSINQAILLDKSCVFMRGLVHYD